MQRTIKIYGYGYSDQAGQQTELRVKLDGETIYQGPVFTPATPDDSEPGSRDFPLVQHVVEWQQSFDAASRQLEITALVGNFCFTSTRSDWMPFRFLNDLATEWSSGLDRYLPCYALEEEPFVYFRDSNHDVRIDGQLQTREPSNDWERLGQWHWYIMQNQTFTSTVLISPALSAPVPPEDPPWSPDQCLIWRVNHDSSV